MDKGLFSHISNTLIYTLSIYPPLVTRFLLLQVVITRFLLINSPLFSTTKATTRTRARQTCCQPPFNVSDPWTISPLLTRSRVLPLMHSFVPCVHYPPWYGQTNAPVNDNTLSSSFQHISIQFPNIHSQHTSSQDIPYTPS